MKPAEFDQRMSEYRSFVEAYLSKYIADAKRGQPQEVLYEAMGYSLLSSAKRLRPVMTLDFCRMCGADWREAMPFAAAVEMIHTYSLIHDDLPCMDNDDYRRGRLTNHKVYGEAMAFLAGDGLLTDAFLMASSARLPSERITFAISVLAENAGSYGMVGGQVLDILSEKRKCTEEEILAVQSRKTGALINAACVLGVIAAGGTQAQIEAAASFAGAIGLAFQIRDDMLDVTGDAEKLGKAVHADAGKNTFVRLYGLPKCEELVKKYTDAALDQLSAFENADFMRTLAISLVNRDR